MLPALYHPQPRCHVPDPKLSHWSGDDTTASTSLKDTSCKRLHKSSGHSNIAFATSPAPHRSLPPIHRSQAAAAMRPAFLATSVPPSDLSRRKIPGRPHRQAVHSNTRKERLVRAASLPAGGYRAAPRGRVSRGRKPGCVGALRRVSPQAVLAFSCPKAEAHWEFRHLKTRGRLS